MPQTETFKVKGLRELIRGLKQLDSDERSEVRKALRHVGDAVRQDATQRFSAIDAYSAAGYRTRVRQRGVIVEQSLRKTTGLRPDYGALQMRRALLPALAENRDETLDALDKALDVAAEKFNRGGSV